MPIIVFSGYLHTVTATEVKSKEAFKVFNCLRQDMKDLDSN